MASRSTPRNPLPEPTTRGIQNRDIVQEIESDFLSYSMSVIMQRALPDARDGLKPVQRRILRAMADGALWSDAKYKKSATVVGDVLGKYHPHGDSSVYDAMVRLAQSFAQHEPLIDGQGNFGTIDDGAAAYRYTEARMTGAAERMLQDIDKQTVDFVPNFDGRLKEPVVLPAGLPNLLLNGAEGIAVGMATKIPPHNLRELVGGIELLLNDPSVSDKAILAKIKGPDFPTGGFLLSSSELKELYTTGRGRMILRARCSLEKVASGLTAIVVTELPYAVSPSKLAQDVQRLVKENTMIPGGDRGWGDAIAAMRDESDREGRRIVLEVKRGADPAMVLAGLYQKTDLQTTYAAQMIALVNRRPEYLSLRRALEVYIDHRIDVLLRRSRFELERAEARVHIIDGLLIAISAIDKVIAIIKKSKDRATAKAGLLKAFKLTEIQAEEILRMRLAQITALDVYELKEERKTLLGIIANLRDILAKPKRQREVVRDELIDAAKPFYRPRRTELLAESASAATTTSAAKRGTEDVVVPSVTLSESTMDVALMADGTIRTFPEGKRKGTVWQAVTLKSTEQAIVVTSSGRVWPVTLTQLGGGRNIPLSVLGSDLEPSERALALVGPVGNEGSEALGGSLVFVYRNGKVKRLALSEVADVRRSGVGAVKLNEGDELLACLRTNDSDTVLLVSREGKALRLSVEGIPAQGRAANGVAGMKLSSGDSVVSASVLGEDGDKKNPWIVGILTGAGLGKRMSETEFPVQGRGSQGVWALRANDKSGEVVWGAALRMRESFLVGEQVFEGKVLPEGNRAMTAKPVKDMGVVERDGVTVLVE